MSRFIALLFSTILVVLPAKAATNSEILSGEDSGTYVGASVEMMAFMAYMQGNKSGYTCIMDWYFNGGHGPQQVVQAMKHFPDKSPQSIIFTLVKRQCGDPRKGSD